MTEIVKRQFVCLDCGKTFLSSYNLKGHIDSKCSTIKSFICEMCQKSFQTIYSLKSHSKIHLLKNFFCSFCSKKFASKGQLVVHERSHTKIQPFVCSVCEKSFSHRESLITHSTVHTKIKPYACENCHQTFSCIGNLIKHRKVRPQSCGLPKFTDKKITKRPEVTTTQIVPVQEEASREFVKTDTNNVAFSCSEVASCPDTNENRFTIQEVIFNDYLKKELDVQNEKESLNDFIIEEHLNDSSCDSNVELQMNDVEVEMIEDINHYFDVIGEQYCCKLCPKMYLKKNISIKHLKIEHQITLKNFIYDNTNNRYRKPHKNQTFSCNVCPKKFTSAKLAEKHEMNHGDDGSLIYKCSCCPLYFDTQLKMEIHQNTAHESRLTCNIVDCLRKFDHPEKLLSHKKYAHFSRVTKKKYVFVCTLCGRSFNTRVAMSDHERSNCGKDPFYKCNLCDKKYKSSGILKCHMKIHTQELNFTCAYCQKKFRTKGQQVSHERTHSRDKPFKCKFSDCDASFSHRESLLTHHTTHSGVKRFKCDICSSQFSCISNLKAHKSRKQNKCGTFTQIQKVENAKSTLKQLNSIIEK